ncbi:MAG: hypothetical protein ACE15D_14235 [Candidatus Eisenbacteria bacterium]|nr:hypothetical protein [Candidatus Eisenbacteria bacterium]
MIRVCARLLVLSAFTVLPALIVLPAATPALAQNGRSVAPNDPFAQFPQVPTLDMYGQVRGFRAEIEQAIARAKPGAHRADSLLALSDRLIAAWDRYGDRIDLEYGDDLPNMRRNRPYWLITTDEAADTLTDRISPLIEAYIKTHPDEKLGPVRAQWEAQAEQLGIPRTRLFGFQFVELARRSGQLRQVLSAANPQEADVVRDANLRFLWDLVQFYRQLHGTWFDRYTMRIAQEDWIVHRTEGRCKDPKWQIAFSLLAIGVDTTNTDPMSDKFMHRIKAVDPECPDTVDFVVPLPHFRLMEQELLKKTDAEKRELLRKVQKYTEEHPLPTPGKAGGATGKEGKP